MRTIKGYPSSSFLSMKNQNEVLNYAMQNGIINLADIQQLVEMTKRQKTLENHKWSIYQGSDGKWRTYLPDDIKGRKLIKKSTKEDVENAIIAYYNAKEKAEQEKNVKCFNDVYFLWREFHDAGVVDNTMAKYDTDYKRYFEDEEFFCKRDITTITEYDIQRYLFNVTKEKKLCMKATKTLFGYMKNTFTFAMRKKYIEENPMAYLVAKDFYKFCVPSSRSQRKKTIVSDDASKLLDQFQKTHSKKENYIPMYAVELAVLTGMRVSEIVALKWDDIVDNNIVISKSEKFNRKTSERYIDDTKNHLIRVFPLTGQISELLDTVRYIQKKNGITSEWIFADETGRIHAGKVSSCIKNKCIAANIQTYGIHAYRRTLNSQMAKDGIPTTVRASLLGHSERVNEEYYTFDIAEMEEKRKIIEKANQKMLAVR